MTLIEALVRLRDDIKAWVSNNLAFVYERTKNIDDNGTGSLAVTDKKRNTILRIDEDGVETTAVKVNKVINRGSDELLVTDQAGNAVMRVDSGGITTTTVTAKSLVVNGQNVSDLGFSGDYNELKNAPAINDDGSSSLQITDNDGNTIMQVDEDGVTTTKVTVDGVDLGDAVDKLNTATATAATQLQELDTEVTALQELVGETPVPEQIQQAIEESGGTATSMTNITDDGSGELVVQDSNGNPVFRVDADGVTTTKITAGGVDLGAAIDALKFETDETLTLADGTLKVNVATEVGDQTLPVTAAAVNTTVGNIEILLATI